MTDDVDPSTVADATASFLEDRADGERVLEHVLEVDDEFENWTFDELDVDSGTFGEIVSRGIVKKVDSEYRVADADVVEAVLAGEEVRIDSEEKSFSERLAFDLGIWGDRRALVGLAGALLLVFVMRITQYRSVFRDDRVVSPGNDPYYYRYWMEELLAESSDPTNLSVIAEMPEGAVAGRPLTHALNWWFAALLGGNQWAADMIAAWLPVVASLALGVVVYALAVVVTRDVRVGIASVVLLAVAPVHVVYTQVGFLEHRLHQYFWLGVTLLTLAWLAVDLTRQRELADKREAVHGHLTSPMTWVAALVLGIALGISVHLWGGSPLLFIPLAVYLGLRAAVDARDGISPTLANLPVVVGLGIGTAISVWVHTNWGWREAFVAYTPAMVFGGAIAVLVLGDLWQYAEMDVRGMVALEAVVAGIGLYAFQRYRPGDWVDARARADDLLLREGYTESASLFTFDHAMIFGPLIQLGVSFYLGVAILVWAVWIAYRRYEPAWLLLAVYASFFMLLAAIQVRFAAQFMIPLSVLGGIGFIYVLSAIDLGRRPLPFQTSGQSCAVAADGGSDDPPITLPDAKKAAYVLGVGLLICGLSLIYVPTLSGQVSHSDAEYEAVVAIEEHAAATEREHPDNFVLSEWGDNRMYNYFVTGESESYSYARSRYGDFVSDSDPDGWNEEFDGRVGYVVVTDVDADPPSESTQVQLLEEFGSSEDGLAHYQLLAVDDDRSAVAFAIVPGATIEGTGDPGDTVAVRTDVSVDGASFIYEREVVVGEDGQLSVTVPYPGEYSIGDESVDIAERDVENGSTLEASVFEGDSN